MKSTGFIIDGVYHKTAPQPDQLIENTQSTYKTWSHDIQREEHQVDIIQPYEAGKPNDDFIMNYPEESGLYNFIEKEQ